MSSEGEGFRLCSVLRHEVEVHVGGGEAKEEASNEVSGFSGGTEGGCGVG